jgi:hypothetical protein
MLQDENPEATVRITSCDTDILNEDQDISDVRIDESYEEETVVIIID